MAKSFEDYTEDELEEIFEDNYEYLKEKFQESGKNEKRDFWMRCFTEVAAFDPAFVARHLEELVATFSTFLRVSKEIERENESQQVEEVLYDHLTERDMAEIQKRWGVSSPFMGMA